MPGFNSRMLEPQNSANTGDVAGSEESPVYALLKMRGAIAPLELPESYQVEQYAAVPPARTDRLAMNWDGEWHID